MLWRQPCRLHKFIKFRAATASCRRPRRWRSDSHYGQWKTQPQFVPKINLHMMQTELLELHPAKVMDIGGMPFHFLELDLHLRLRQDLLLVHTNDARALLEFPCATAPSRPDTEPHTSD